MRNIIYQTPNLPTNTDHDHEYFRPVCEHHAEMVADRFEIFFARSSQKLPEV